MKKIGFLFVLTLSLFSMSLSTKINNYQINNNFSKEAINNGVIEKSFNDTIKPKTNLLSPVFANTFINSLDDLISYNKSETSRPSNIILKINKDLNLIDENNNLLINDLFSSGMSFLYAYNTYIKEKMLPVIYFDNEEAKDSLSNFLDTTLCPIDMALCSNNPSLLKSIRSTNNGSMVRGILDLKDTTNFNKEEAIKLANTSFANTIILSEAQASEEVIRYLESRFKSVWVNTSSDTSDLEIAKLITDGVYGIISPKVKEALNVFTYFENTDNKTTNVNRPSFNIAHRGNPITNYTNSLEGFIESYERGATHIELDVMSTTDNKLVVMHDNSLAVSTNGYGYVSNMSSEEIKQFKITKNANGMEIGGGVNIPFLDDVFKEFKGNNKIIIVEIKDSNPNTVSNLKTYLDEYDMYNQVVIIAFDNNQLIRCKDLIPEVPCATLNNMNNTMFNDITANGVAGLNLNNYGNDFNKGVFNEDFDFDLAERGFLGYYWTYSNISEIYNGLINGVVGITNDYPTTMELFPTKLVVNDELGVTSVDNLLDTTFEANYLMYNGKISEKTLEAKPFIYEENSDGTISAILQGLFLGPSGSPRYRGVYFSDVITIKVGSESGSPQKTNLGLILGISIPLGVILLGGGIALYFVIKKKKVGK